MIQAQAAVHTTKLTMVATLASDAEARAGAAGALAQAKIDESVLRRGAMVVVVALIVVNVAVLYAAKRRLDRNLEARTRD